MDARNQERVRIAKDVIRWVSIEKPDNLVIKTGSGYLQLGYIGDSAISGSSYGNYFTSCLSLDFGGSVQKRLQDIFLKKTREVCQVCGIGAMLLARVMNDPTFESFSNGIGRGKAEMALADAFTDGELDLVEGAFECWTVNLHLLNDYAAEAFPTEERSRVYHRWVAFFESKEPADRIVYMMNHIIKNNGEIKVADILEECPPWEALRYEE